MLSQTGTDLFWHLVLVHSHLALLLLGPGEVESLCQGTCDESLYLPHDALEAEMGDSNKVEFARACYQEPSSLPSAGSHFLSFCHCLGSHPIIKASVDYFSDKVKSKSVF